MSIATIRSVEPTLERSPETSPSAPSFALFAYGFRPFFLAAGAVAPLLVICWLAALLGGHHVSRYYDPLTWHAHEMVFGFAGAMIAGFLLTAVPNWTGTEAPRGRPLILLSLLWVAGRVLPLLSSSRWVGVVDLCFIPALACLLVPPLLAKRQLKSLVFVPILGGLTLANVLIHAQRISDQPGLSRLGLRIAVGLVILLIVIIGGRVIPFFTACAVPRHAEAQRRWPAVEMACVISALLLPLLDEFSAPWAAGLCAVAAVAHAARMKGWCLPGVTGIPLLWVLYAGYGWIAVGFGLKALSVARMTPDPLATHAFATGAIAMIGLGIMARASLGHTGRALQPSVMTVASFGCLFGAAILRVGGPLLGLPIRPVLVGTGILWTAAFSLFLLVYTPILLRARADGKSG